MRLAIAALLLGASLMVACSPERPRLAASAEAAGRPADSAQQLPARTAIDPLQRAETILARELGPSRDSSVAAVQFTGGLIQVTLNRPTATLGDTDLYARICNALRAVIDPTADPSPVVGVQLFRADGSPVVSSAAPDAPCGRFYR